MRWLEQTLLFVAIPISLSGLAGIWLPSAWWWLGPIIGPLCSISALVLQRCRFGSRWTHFPGVKFELPQAVAVTSTYGRLYKVRHVSVCKPHKDFPIWLCLRRGRFGLGISLATPIQADVRKLWAMIEKDVMAKAPWA